MADRPIWPQFDRRGDCNGCHAAGAKVSGTHFDDCLVQAARDEWSECSEGKLDSAQIEINGPVDRCKRCNEAQTANEVHLDGSGVIAYFSCSCGKSWHRRGRIDWRSAARYEFGPSKGRRR